MDRNTTTGIDTLQDKKFGSIGYNENSCSSIFSFFSITTLNLNGFPRRIFQICLILMRVMVVFSLDFTLVSYIDVFGRWDNINTSCIYLHTKPLEPPSGSMWAVIEPQPRIPFLLQRERFYMRESQDMVIKKFYGALGNRFITYWPCGCAIEKF